jgi:hypothetical protein
MKDFAGEIPGIAGGGSIFSDARLDELVRAHPEHAYDRDFFERLSAEGGWQPGRTPTRPSRAE